MKYVTLAATVSIFAMASVASAGGLNDAYDEGEPQVAVVEDASSGFALPIILGIGGAAIVALVLTSDSSTETTPVN